MCPITCLAGNNLRGIVPGERAGTYLIKGKGEAQSGKKKNGHLFLFRGGRKNEGSTQQIR